MVDPLDDQALLELAQSGDRQALDRLLTALSPQVWMIARRIMGSDADAADASQEALIAVARGIARFDGRSAIATWVHRVATNACLDELRRRRRRAIPVDEFVDTIDPSTTETGVVDRWEIDRAMATLTPEFRAVLVLREVLGHDYETIASLLAVPIGTVRSRLARARLQLATTLIDSVSVSRNLSAEVNVQPIESIRPERQPDA